MKNPHLFLFIIAFFFSCNTSSEKDKNPNHILAKRGNDFYKNEEYLDAKLCYDTLISIDSAEAEFYFKRAYCKTMLSADDPTAIEDYLKAIAHNYRRKQNAYLNIGVAHRFKALFRSNTDQDRIAEYDTALYFYNECLKIEPSNAKGLKEKEQVEENLNRFKQ